MAQLQLVQLDPGLHNMKTCYLRAFFEADIFTVAAELIALVSDVSAELDCIIKRCKLHFIKSILALGNSGNLD